MEKNINLIQKIFGIYVVKNVLKLFWIFPIRANRIMFCSYLGKGYCCNPKYIYQYMRKQKGYQFVWVINQRNKVDSEIEMCTLVSFKSLRYFYYLLTSSVYINNGIAPSYIPFRKRQRVIGTWHGGGAYKKSGIETEYHPLKEKLLKLVAENVDYVIVACRDLESIMEQAFCVPKSKILRIGMPRNDLFFHPDLQKVHRIKNRLQVPAENCTVLYAPTFRSNLSGIESDFHDGDYDLDVDGLLEALKVRFGGNWVLLFRSHYYLKSRINHPAVIDVSEYDDMQELLMISDVLINDYSSSMWDFGLQNRPCFIFAKDLAEYEHTRGFYTPPARWPFPLATTNEELIENIKMYDENNYKEKLQNHYADLGSFEQGTASAQIVALIAEE